MKIPVWILTLFGAALLSMEAWTLNTVVNLNADVAAIKAVLKTNNPQLAQNE